MHIISRIQQLFVDTLKSHAGFYMGKEETSPLIYNVEEYVIFINRTYKLLVTFFQSNNRNASETKRLGRDLTFFGASILHSVFHLMLENHWLLLPYGYR